MLKNISFSDTRRLGLRPIDYQAVSHALGPRVFSRMTHPGARTVANSLKGQPASATPVTREGIRVDFFGIPGAAVKPEDDFAKRSDGALICSNLKRESFLRNARGE